jgi:hypothetical protein
LTYSSILKEKLTPFRYQEKIRLGKNSDGGYVVSKNHLGEKLLSLGCENATTFEEHYLSRVKDSTVEIYDGTSNCDLADKDQRVKFHNKNVYSLSEINVDRPCMVQMDIEGSELNFFNADLEKLTLVEQLVLEIHFHEQKYPEFPQIGTFDKWYDFFSLMNKYFSLIHIHVNDNGIAQKRPNYYGMYDLLELTYIKKDETLERETSPFPLEGLDFPNGYGINPKIDWWLL